MEVEPLAKVTVVFPLLVEVNTALATGCPLGVQLPLEFQVLFPPEARPLQVDWAKEQAVRKSRFAITRNLVLGKKRQRLSS